MDTLKSYYLLTKPGIIRGNLLTAAAGFVVASGSLAEFDWSVLLALLVSVALIIGSACVINNYIDRDIDQKMARTKTRALATGDISAANALVYAVSLGAVGFTVLVLCTNPVTVLVGAIGFIDYVSVYTLSKRRTWHATLLGSICGSTPVVAGYTAVAARFDAGALILFLILTFWQMPHFYAIALRRFDDYRAAGIPVLPAVHGNRATKLQMLAYMVAFVVAVIALYAWDYAGWFYLVTMGGLSLGWLVIALRGWRSKDTKKWALSVFLYSLILLPALLATTLIDSILVG